MLTIIPALLNPAEIAGMQRDLANAPWADGRATAGAQGAAVKRNRQLTDEVPVARNWGNRILDALGRSPRFVSAALPHRIIPPLFSRYDVGDAFGIHVDNAIRVIGSAKVRTDLAATLFLSDPASYSGILYLSRPEDCAKPDAGGTDFFRHRRTGLEAVPQDPARIAASGYDNADALIAEVVNRDTLIPAKWERALRVPARFNRLLLFSPWQFHNAAPGFGVNAEDARLVMLLFFAPKA